MNYGWVKLYRDLQEKAIWRTSTPEQKVVLITILLLANHKSNEWEFAGRKFKCEPGQFVTSLDSLAKECGKNISIQNVRTALNKFEKYGFLTNQSTKTGRMISVVNWEKYQGIDYEPNKASTKELTKRSQSTNKDLTTNKNDKNDKNDKNEIYKYIVDYLNKKAGTNYRASTKKTQTCIHARIAEGFTFDDFKMVIDKKCADWLGNEKMEPYLRPETLFGTKFESYLNAKVTNRKPVNTGMAAGDEDILDGLF